MPDPAPGPEVEEPTLDREPTGIPVPAFLMPLITAVVGFATGALTTADFSTYWKPGLAVIVGVIPGLFFVSKAVQVKVETYGANAAMWAGAVADDAHEREREARRVRHEHQQALQRELITNISVQSKTDPAELAAAVAEALKPPPAPLLSKAAEAKIAAASKKIAAIKAPAKKVPAKKAAAKKKA